MPKQKQPNIDAIIAKAVADALAKVQAATPEAKAVDPTSWIGKAVSAIVTIDGVKESIRLNGTVGKAMRSGRPHFDLAGEIPAPGGGTWRVHATGTQGTFRYSRQ